MESNPGASIVLAGDFNQLDLAEVSAFVGLLPLVSQPTRGIKVLDMIMTSDPMSYSIKVITSTVRSDHKAVLATTTLQKDITKAPIIRTFCRRTPAQHAELLFQLRNFDAAQLLEDSNAERAWELHVFYLILASWLVQLYPLRTITLTSRDSPYMTPGTKFLLRRKNRLMRQGRLEEASAIAVKIGRAIARFNSRELRKLNSSSPAGTKK